MMECAARIKPGFLPQSIIFPSQAVRARTEQVAPWGGELTLAPVQDADARPRGLHPGQFAAECLRCRFAPRSGGETPRLIDSLPRVRAIGFAGALLVSFLQQTAPPAHARLRLDYCPGALSARPANRPVRARTKLYSPSARTQRFYAASRVSSPKNCLYQIKKVYTVHTRRLLSALPFLWSSKSFTSFSVWKNFWAFSPVNSSRTML